jgi:chemotaxis protein histidine kinase CheA
LSQSGANPKMPVALSALDPAAVARAEAALKSLEGNFNQWLNDEIAKLEAARAQITEAGQTAETMEGLYLRAHDLKGLGGTYGYPAITRIASLLCAKIADKRQRLETSLSCIDAHIEAIKTVVRDGIKSEEHPEGLRLISDLERLSA